MEISEIINTNLKSTDVINANKVFSVGNKNVSTITSQALSDTKLSGPSVIPGIEPPISRSLEVPIIRGMSLPIFDVPNTKLSYPIINVPTQEQFNAAVKADKEKQTPQKEEKTRELSDNKPFVSPTIQQQFIPKIETPKAEIQAQPTTTTFTINGIDIDLPDPSVVATAGAVAVVTTATTMVSGIALNMIKNAAEPVIKEAMKKKFKIKLKQVKPVLHYVLAEEGHIDIFEYSAQGTKFIKQVDNVEQYIRDHVDINALYEVENKIIIDDSITDRFTKEGQKRFKSLFAPAKNIAKKLASKLSI